MNENHLDNSREKKLIKGKEMELSKSKCKKKIVFLCQKDIKYIYLF